MRTADYWIEALRLIAHAEGGYYRETYRASERIPAEALPGRYRGDRALSTAILFLLRSGQCSAFHRIRSDELWHFHAGSPLTVHVIASDGHYRLQHLGQDPERGQRVQSLVPAGHWFGATVDEPDSFSLVGCTVAPGFEFADFELADRQMLLAVCPEQRAVIEMLTPSLPAGETRRASGDSAQK